MYVAIMNIRSKKAQYTKGEILGKEFSEKEIARLIEIGAVFSRGVEEKVEDTKEINFLNKEELEKIRTKKEICEYAKEIGLTLSDELTKEKLIDEILNYIEETEDLEN